jgi:hypothetical protein
MYSRLQYGLKNVYINMQAQLCLGGYLLFDRRDEREFYTHQRIRSMETRFG